MARTRLPAYETGTLLSAAALRERHQRLAAGASDPRSDLGNWVIQDRPTGRLAGYVQATITAGLRGGEAEIAWVVGTGWQGQGLATEAARGLARWLAGHGVTTTASTPHPSGPSRLGRGRRGGGPEPSGGWHDGEQRWQGRSRPALTPELTQS